jgi:hypothetical protein
MTPGLCTVCQLPCIALCPACRKPVHYGYGHGNDNCSGRHESACPGAKTQRELPVPAQPPPPPEKKSSKWLRKVKRKKKRKS